MKGLSKTAWKSLFPSRRKPRIGLVLGSGGARGWAHVGVCLELFDHGIEPRCIVGTSMGAIVGAIAAAGRLPALPELARRMDWQQAARLFVEVGLHRSGLLDGRNVERFLRELIGPGRIEDLPVPFAAVATDLMDESEVLLNRGDTVDALRASISIPGLFTPVRRDGRWLVDGGLVNPLPVDVARAMGADVVIASEINLRSAGPGETTSERSPSMPDGGPVLTDQVERVLAFVRRRSRRLGNRATAWAESVARTQLSPSIFDVLLRATRIGENRITLRQLECAPPDHLIQSPVGRIGTLEFHRGPEAIAAGRRAAQDWIRQTAG